MQAWMTPYVEHSIHRTAAKCQEELGALLLDQPILHDLAAQVIRKIVNHQIDSMVDKLLAICCDNMENGFAV